MCAAKPARVPPPQGSSVSAGLRARLCVRRRRTSRAAGSSTVRPCIPPLDILAAAGGGCVLCAAARATNRTRKGRSSQAPRVAAGAAAATAATLQAVIRRAYHPPPQAAASQPEGGPSRARRVKAGWATRERTAPARQLAQARPRGRKCAVGHPVASLRDRPAARCCPAQPARRPLCGVRTMRNGSQATSFSRQAIVFASALQPSCCAAGGGSPRPRRPHALSTSARLSAAATNGAVATASDSLSSAPNTANPRGNMRCTRTRRRNGCKASNTAGLSNAAYAVGRARSGMPCGRRAARHAKGPARRYESARAKTPAC